MRSRFHRPWQPRMSDGHEFNPFVRTTEPEASFEEHRNFEDLEADAQESEACESNPEPAQGPETPSPGTSADK